MRIIYKISSERGHLNKTGMTSKCWSRKICVAINKEIEKSPEIDDFGGFLPNNTDLDMNPRGRSLSLTDAYSACCLFAHPSGCRAHPGLT